MKFSSSQVPLVVVVVFFLFASCHAMICPDQKISCRIGQTCCREKQGGYGCCPYANATCCADGQHCCPEGTICDVSAGRCRRSSGPIKQIRLIPTSILDIKSIEPGLDIENELESDTIAVNTTLTDNAQICPDQHSSCPTSYTCCMDTQGTYACCPFPLGTCCPDRIHCCPHGRRCIGQRCQ